jgi:hypothetical protein
MAGGRPGIEPASLPYGNILPCGRTASGNTPYFVIFRKFGAMPYSGVLPSHLSMNRL